MGMRPLDGVGLGQPNVIEQSATAHQERLTQGVQLDIPKNWSGQVRDENRDQRTPTGLTHEEAAEERGNAWEARRLQSFSNWTRGDRRGGSSNTSGAVVIDQGATRE